MRPPEILATYRRGAECRKCGALDASTFYKADNDLIRRVCKLCGFAWDELPRDRVSA